MFLFFVSAVSFLKVEEFDGKGRNESQDPFFLLLAYESRNLRSDLNNKNEEFIFCFFHLTSVHKIFQCYVQNHFQIM